jgi:hypothetical protein
MIHLVIEEKLYLASRKTNYRIFFNRMDKFLEHNNIICSQQIGFIKAMGTSDHILTLKTLIDKYFRKKPNIFFLAFILI